MLKQYLAAAVLAVAGLSLATSAAEISQGEYLARAGDCIACHTAPGGEPFAGGHALDAPVGTIYSTNITPHPELGIGSYSLAQFDAAVRGGKTPQHALYPAMPFASYEKLGDDDLRALYDYFMQEVKPVARANQPADIDWPFNMRWPLAVWNSLFTDKKTFVENPDRSASWNRGAYLVQGLGHCGTCHTPRSVTLAEKGYTEASDSFLAGAELGGWFAPSLRGLERFDDDQLFALLSRGHSRDHAFAGPMADVVGFSLSYLNEADVRAMIEYLRSLPPVASTGTLRAIQTTPAQRKDGDLLYQRYCSTCHGVTGEGEPHVVPQLATNKPDQHQQAVNLVNVILHGAEGASLRGEIAYEMPGYADLLSDQQVANLANSVLSHPDWGAQQPLVTAQLVGQLRQGPARLNLQVLLYAGLAVVFIILLLLWWVYSRRRNR